jgi:hypothetical protein
LARLLRYAGLENAHVHVDDDALVHAETGPKDGGTVEVDFGMPVAFVGESEHMGELCLTFRVDLTAVGDVDFLVGAAAREVARAVRHHRGLHRLTDEASDDENVANEEQLVDVTSHVIGLGVLTTNNALRHRSDGELRGYTIISRSRRTQAGAVSPRAMAFLLAAVAVARGIAAAAFASHLEPNQQTWLKADMKGLSLADLQQRLSLPPSSNARPTPALDAFLAPVEPLIASCDDTVCEVAADAASDFGARNAGHPVFRVARRATGWGVAGGFFVGAACFAGLAAAAPLAATLALLAGIGGGAAVGRQLRRGDKCASCEVLLNNDAPVCPGCGGQIVGRIARADDRLIAEEAWEKANALAAAELKER